MARRPGHGPGRSDRPPPGDIQPTPARPTGAAGRSAAVLESPPPGTPTPFPLNPSSHRQPLCNRASRPRQYPRQRAAQRQSATPENMGTIRRAPGPSTTQQTRADRAPQQLGENRGLLLGRYRNIAHRRQVAQKGTHRRFAHLRRVAFSMSQDEPAGPAQSGVFRAAVVVPELDGLPERFPETTGLSWGPRGGVPPPPWSKISREIFRRTSTGKGDIVRPSRSHGAREPACEPRWYRVTHWSRNKSTGPVRHSGSDRAWRSMRDRRTCSVFKHGTCPVN